MRAEAVFTVDKPFDVRRGLGRVAGALASSRPITIAWFGGSITYGANASDIEQTSYRALTAQWLVERYPQAKIQSVNSAIGGTGSDLGAFRLNRDALGHEPDLLLVEFAVNDAGRNDRSILRAMEGIVRQALGRAPQPQIVFIYTLSKAFIGDLVAGRLPRTFALHEQVAEHYQLPAINLAMPVAAAVDAGGLNWDQFSDDMVHPTDAGFQWYARTMRSALTAMFDAPVDARGVTDLPEPLTDTPMSAATMAELTDQLADDRWTWSPRHNRGGWDCYNGLLESDTPGATLVVPFEGTTVGLLGQIGAESGDIEWAVDDQPFVYHRMFDQFCLQFSRPGYWVLAEDLPPGRHTLRLRITDQADPRSKGRRVQLAALLVE
jgi:lysophospholipase L1-like esterase